MTHGSTLSKTFTGLGELHPHLLALYIGTLTRALLLSYPPMCMGESKLMESLLAHKASLKPNKEKRKSVDKWKWKLFFNTDAMVIIQECGVI
jgi:hypothetical protein